MNDLLPAVITILCFIFSCFYMGLVRVLVSHKKFSSDNYFQILAKSCLQVLSNFLKLTLLRRNTTTTIFQSIISILIVFVTLLGIFINFKIDSFPTDIIFLTYVLLTSISLGLFSSFTILYRKNIDTDMYVLNIIINMVIIISMLLITESFSLKDKVWEDVLTIIFWIVSIRLSSNIFQNYRTQKRELFLENIYIVWYIGFAFTITGYFVQKINYHLTASMVATEIVAALFLMTAFTILTKQYAIVKETKKLKKLIGTEALISFILILIRICLWKI